LDCRCACVFPAVVIPTAIPSLFFGLRLGLFPTPCWRRHAELIAASRAGHLSYYSTTFDADGVFAVLLVSDRLADALSMIMTRVERWLICAER